MGPLSILPEKIFAKDGDTGINEKVYYSIKLGKSFYFLLDVQAVSYGVCISKENDNEVKCTGRKCLNCVYLHFSVALQAEFQSLWQLFKTIFKTSTCS